MGSALADSKRGPQETRPALRVYGHGSLEYRASRRGTPDLGFCHLSRSGQRAFATSRLRRFGGRSTANSVGLGKAAERGPDGLVVRSLAPATLAGGHRLAPRSVLRRSAPQPQRTLPIQDAERHDAFSRLCHRLHRSIRTSLHVGSHVDSAPRKYGDCGAAPVGALARNGRENQGCAGGSGVFQRAGDGLVARGKNPFSDAGCDYWPEAQEDEFPSRQERSALDQTSEGWLVSLHHEKPPSRGNLLGVCILPHLLPTQETDTRAAETALRGLASPRDTDRDPRTVPQTFWHRIELPSTAAGANLYLHAKSPVAIGLYCHRLVAPESLGLDPCDALVGTSRANHEASASALALQAAARLDCPGDRSRTS